MSYTKTNWTNNSAPAISAENLNKIENQLEYLTNSLTPAIGDIEINITGINPGTKYTGTTWIQFGQGKTLVGLNSSDTDFDTAEEIGGAKGAWRHNHQLDAEYGAQASASYPPWSAYTQLTGPNGGTHSWSGVAMKESGSTNNTIDVDKANMPPYIVVYFWKRTA